MIEFKKVRCKNFLSYGNYWTEIDFTKLTGTTLITGKNASGKSSIILDTLAFGLFGVPYRFINKPRLVNSINGSDCIVEVEFEISKKKYKVVRGIKPNIFEIYCDGILLNQSSKTLDYQRYLESHILKINFDSFCQIVVLGSATFVPFMELSAQDRRSVIEDLLDLKVFSLMNDTLKKQYTSLKDEIKSVDNSILILQEKVSMQENYCKKIQDAINTNTQFTLEEIQKHNDRIQILNSELSKIENLMIPYRDIKSIQSKKGTSLAQYKSLLSSLKDRLNKNLSEVEYYNNNQNATCSSCGQNIDDKFLEEIINKKKDNVKKLQDAILDVNVSIENLLKEIEDLHGKNEEYVALLCEQGKKTSEISWLNSTISKLNSSLNSVDKNEYDKENIKLDEMKNQVVVLNQKKDKLSIIQKNYDIVNVLLKDSGIKSKIIKQYLPTINRCINKYLGAMDFFVNFNLDENFKETIKSRNRDVFEYNSFSQGEKFRIDMALMLTWREVSKSKNSVNTNILVLDEVFDGSMDSHGTEEFLKLINHVANSGVSVFVISHKNDSFTDKFNNYIKVEKKSNFSRMEIL